MNSAEVLSTSMSQDGARAESGASPAPPGDSVLTIVIPALNEEASIESTVMRCLAARERICIIGGVRDVEIIVVSDGSTDRTASIAQDLAAREPAVSVVVFEKNRGYGAAIKEGFGRGRGDLVSFLDADGTCDPNYFAELCRALRTQDAAVAVGSRMQPGSQMPAVRKIGNTVYALLLGALGGKTVTDTASGMRVLRRDALAALYPLPDGLHFTPAMSARAVMGRQRIVEIPMTYAERVGDSKLHVMRDGVRFLNSIRDAVLLYQPGKIFGMAAACCVAIGIVWSVYPVQFYLRNRALEEWMIYRLLLSGFLLHSAFGFICAGVLGEHVLSLVYRRPATFLSTLGDRFLHRWTLVYVGALTAVVAIALVWPGLVQYVETGHVTIHWSRPIAAVFLLQVSVFAVIYGVLQKIVDLWNGQLTHTNSTSRR